MVKKKPTQEEREYKKAQQDYLAKNIDYDTFKHRLDVQITQAMEFGETNTKVERGSFLNNPENIFAGLEHCRCREEYRANPVLEKACRCAVEKETSNKPEDELLNCQDYKTLNKKNIKQAEKKKNKNLL